MQKTGSENSQGMPSHDTVSFSYAFTSLKKNIIYDIDTSLNTNDSKNICGRKCCITFPETIHLKCYKFCSAWTDFPQV